MEKNKIKTLEPKDLRIGNYIYADYDGEGDKRIVEVFAIFESGEINAMDLDNPNGDIDEHSWEYLEEIPLTEEWLLKFGLLDGNNFNTDGVYIQYMTKSDYETDCESFYNGYYLTVSESKLISNRIEYVHQLQNLYFALKGKQLTLIK